MEPSQQSKSTDSSINDPQLIPELSDLNHVTHLDEELQNKLDLKDGDEIHEKVSNFEVAAVESEKGQECDNGDGWNGDDDGWNGDDEVNDWVENVNVNENVVVSGEVDQVENKDERSNGNGRAELYPLRPEAEDCSFYLKTGTCKFGSNCKFNHPLRRRSSAFKERVGDRDELEKRAGQTECKYYSRSGGCMFGKDCKFDHSRGKYSAVQVLEFNFLGLPIRLGEKECPYYMQTGSCKFGATCKFNHPDPTTVGGYDSTSAYGNGSSISLHNVSQSSSTRKFNETATFVPIIISPSPGVSPRSSEWNGYQAPIYLSERGTHPPSPYAVKNPAIETNAHMHRHKQTSAEEFPERPGEPECSFFLKTGDCKFKFHCKFHHPKNRITRSPPCSLSDKGLPLRPGQNTCTHYSRYGICKFGPACKFDHPINMPPPTMPGLYQQSSYTNSASVEEAGNGDASDATNQ
ncbi:zinc finger CCCH domain-containing protein 67-like [Vicia villosa]|uniref:zinc finger CCCH domain-containing protein 67-like n=1 Tax=Vicia villosa TaxID=3911 RepID=UPI00273CAC19|nr:zinc finger CCCH domain-containing protein 67-like [Vicia villosa]